MRNRFRDSLTAQVFVLGMAIILSLLVIFLVNTNHIKNSIKTNTIEMNEKLMGQIENNISEYYEHLNGIAMTLAYSPTTESFFQKNELDRILSLSELSVVLSNAMLLESDIAGVYLYDRDSKLLASVGKKMSNDILKCETATEIRISNLFCPEEGDTFYYTMSYPIFDLNSPVYGKQIGMGIFVLKTDSLADMLTDSGLTASSQIYLTDGSERIIATTGNDAYTVMETGKKQSNNDYLVQCCKLDTLGWQLISRIARQELYKSAYSGEKALGFFYAMTCTMILLLVYFCYKRFIQRIYKVDCFIKNIVEYPEGRLKEKGNDEISRVIKRLNQMLDDKEQMNQQIQNSQKRMYEIQLAKERVQLLAYRNQINPHFLYNTLECIGSMALYYDVEEIAEITLALSKVFRFAIKGENIVTIQQEIEYIKEYTTIIDYRFMGRIKIEINVEEELLQNKVIKLILQPIVENAVFHGLEQKMGDGKVQVTIKRKLESYIMLTVEDNGCGIEQEKLQQIRRSLEGGEDKKGIGLANIFQRLKLFYEEDVVFEIKSKFGEGTKVMIVIPDHVEER